MAYEETGCACPECGSAVYDTGVIETDFINSICMYYCKKCAAHFPSDNCS